MKTLLRTLLYLALVVWVGAEIFIPEVAATTFGTLRSDTHAAGTIVGHLLRTLHGAGLVCGVILLGLLALAPAWNIYKPRTVLAPMILVLLMMLSTAYSQFIVIPAMERDRIAAGGAIDASDPTNQYTADFNKLHNQSFNLEMVTLLLGIAAVVMVARAETARA
jgi:hypothetical protein